MIDVSDAPRHVGDTRELLDFVSLTEVRVFEIRARATADPSNDDSDPEIDVDYNELHGPDWLVDRFRFTVKTPDAEYLADVASVYTLSEPVEYDDATRADFAERVGIMTAYPYIRESIATSAARLGRRVPVLAIIRPGDFTITPPSEDAGPESVTTATERSPVKG